MTHQQRVDLWDAINRYVISCGGDPGRHVYGNIPRMTAVADVERLVREVSAAVASPPSVVRASVAVSYDADGREVEI